MSPKDRIILVTGFAPFGGDARNPSYEAVRLLPDRLNGTEILKAELPVLFEKGAGRLLSLIDAYMPDAVLCTGLAGGRRALTPEVIAVNLRDARIPDNAGRQPRWEKIDVCGPDGLFSTLPVRQIASALKEAGIPAELSFSAGTFVCNEVMYRLLREEAERFPGMMGGFVHVPCADGMGDGGKEFSLPIEEIGRGLEVCIGTIADCLSGRGTKDTDRNP